MSAGRRPIARPAGLLAAALLALASLLARVPGPMAHEVRPAYLALTETAPGLFDVLFKTPMVGDMRLALHVELPASAQAVSPVLSRRSDDALVQSWRVRARDGLEGQVVGVAGLDASLSDALLRVEFADGRSVVERLTPSRPKATIPARPSRLDVAATYLPLGVEHILTGVDHLLFVFGLMLLTRGNRRLVMAITAFTVAHSITLAAATLGYVHAPQRPVEAVIALSIAFVALEAAHARQGREGLGARAPWIVAFLFGLLHGFGFAGALSETGLPEGHIPIALLFFNVGVEAGQLLFVTAVLGVGAAIASTRLPIPRWAALAPPYAVGSLAMFWVFQRLSSF